MKKKRIHKNKKPYTYLDFVKTKNQLVKQFFVLDNQQTFLSLFNQSVDNIKKHLETILIPKLIHLLLPYVTLSSIEIKPSLFPQYLYFIVFIKESYNHPYIIYCHIRTNYLTMLFPYGKHKLYKQVLLDDYENAMVETFKNYFDKYHYYGFYLLFNTSIETRKRDMLTNNKYSLLNCDNIQPCITEKKKILKDVHLMTYQKNKKIKEIEMKYQQEAIELLKYFFTLLEQRNYIDAYSFLGNKKKGRLNPQNKFYRKKRLDNFFKKNKSLIGHIKIFIDLYQFTSMLLQRINS